MPKDDEMIPTPGTLSASGGAAVSAGDPLAPFRSRMSTLQSNINNIPGAVRLTDVRDAAENVETLSNHIADLANHVRELGYAWDKDLEPRCLDYRRRWQELKPQVMVAIERESTTLSNRVTQVSYQGNYALKNATNPATADQVLADGERAVNGLLSEAQAATNSIRGMFDKFSQELSQEENGLNKVQDMLQRAAQSKISWLPGEAVVLDVPAQWVRENDDDPKGYLFLTDQRVLFERDENVATKKVLFITTATQHVEQVMLTVPLAQVASVTGTKQGLMGHEDHVEFQFASGAPAAQAHFHIDGQDANDWQAQVNRARTGGLESTRVAGLSDAERQRLKNAPTKCPNCGGPLTAPILRGQTEIKCPACGTVMRF